MKARAAFPLLFGFLAIFGSSRAGAQTVTLDEGTFRLRLGGQEVGTETFNIRQNGSGESAVVIAVGKVVIDTARGGQEINAQLSMKGPALHTSAYQVNRRGAEPVEDFGARGRYTVQRTNHVRCWRANARVHGQRWYSRYGRRHGAPLLFPGAASWLESARVPVLVPRQSRQFTVTVTSRGTEPVSVGGSSIEGRHLVVSAPGNPDRHVG
jgi:hypothetical protein